MGYAEVAAVEEAQRSVRHRDMLPWDRKPFVCYVAEYLCHVQDSKSTVVFIPFASSGFNPSLQRETAVGIVLSSVQEPSSRVLPRQKTIHFLVCAFLGEEQVLWDCLCFPLF